ncbi:MAG: alcohol dehydrogenase catalytic domain-containing protein [bacterium]|nr:alcohol dehydrogenase catalytic domain-containing protein [bacterium]
MKALVYHAKEDLRFVDLPDPEIKENEILLKTKKVGICGTDLHIYHGGMNVPTPLVLGHEFVGDVVKVGSAVGNVKVGDRAVAEHVIGCGICSYCKIGKKNICLNPIVFGLHKSGALAEYMAIPADLVYALPEGMDYDQGVLVEPLSIAVYAMRQANVQIGDRVAIIGQGPIGLFTDQVAKAAGATVYGVDILDSRLAYAKDKGFIDEPINSKSQNPVQVIQELTGEDGVDVVFEAVGIESTAQIALDITRRGGRVLVLGVYEHNVSINMMNIVKKELEVKGSWTCLNSIESTIHLLQSGKINTESFITHRYAFDDSIKAFEDASGYGENRIKSLIEF